LFNLRYWSPFSGSSAAQGVVLTPSGRFPGGVDDGRRPSFFLSGDQGLDCVFPGFFWALCAFSQDSSIISFSFRVMLVIWSITAWN
jgi:hypothetical protein